MFESHNPEAAFVLGLCQKPVLGARVLDHEKKRQMMTLLSALETDVFDTYEHRRSYYLGHGARVFLGVICLDQTCAAS